MKTGKKVILIACLVFLLCAIALGGAVLYYYAHPSSVKDLVERSLSRVTGASVTIRSLSYALDPLHLSVKGITVEPGTDMHGFYLEAPDLYAEFFLNGSFGRKSLIVKRLEVMGISCRISQEPSVSGVAQGPQTPSFFTPILKRAFAFFVFRDVTLEGATLTDGTAVVQSGDRTLRVHDLNGRLNALHRVEISCSARFEWPSRQMLLLAPRVRMKTDGAISLVNTQIGFFISLDDVLFESPFADLKDLQAGARLVYRPDRGAVTFEDMKVTLQEADIKESGQKDRVRLDLYVTADGAFGLKDHQVTVRRLNLSLGDRLKFEGELDAAFGTRKKMDLKVMDCRVMPQHLIPLLPTGLRKRADPVKLEGPIHLTGRIGGVEEGTGWSWNADMEARLRQNQVSFTSGHVRMSTLLTGSIEARGRVPDMEVSTDLKGQGVVFRGNGIEVGPFEAAVSFRGRYPVLDLKDLSARIPSLSVRFQDRAIRVDDIHLEAGKGRVNAETRTGSLPEIRFDSSLLKNITASLEAAEGTLKVVEIQGKETGLAGLAMGLDLLPSGWHLAGRDSVHVQVRVDGDKGMAVASELTFQDLGFQNPKGTFVGENLHLKATVKAKTDPSRHVVNADISVDADGGETLYDRFYVNLKTHPLASRCTGTYNMQERDLQLSRLSLGLKDLLTCEVKGRIVERKPAWQLDLTADIPELPLKPLFRFLVVEPYQAEKPLLGTLQLDGAVSAGVSVTGISSAWTTQGSLRWRQGRISSEERGVGLTGIELALPLWVQNHDREGAGTAMEGGLSIDSLRVPFIPEQALAVSLRAGPNRLSVVSPTRVKIPGGEVRLGPVMIDHLPGAATVSTGLAMDRVDMGALLAPFWPRSLVGTLTGTLNPIRVEGGKLSSSGALTARVFDGEVIFSDPGVSGLFAGTPIFKMNARWKDLNLSKLTADTAFGKIEGVLNGYAKGLEIAQGQVQKFDLLVETVKKEGTSQRISVKAVDNIAQIGGGQSPFVGMAGMFASVFKEFPYEKIGVHATLENDVFRINGTIKEGDTEYLVKRGLLSGVNVVNQNPDTRVSFKDMIKRIRRIKTSQDGPVIK
ncbi:MAG: hypothetical protein R6X27_13130 [Candidatus Desulfacyla sp.]